ncbi:High mobility group protein B3 [Tupaia chinensis]|uniref:High mobility group protein B3 n=1 Tax=Tupaia chinensis TaxID=246437 RepID=L9L6G0_TUPCH|nr:High mobility group protein B3 [Tupaia chinensis]
MELVDDTGGCYFRMSMKNLFDETCREEHKKKDLEVPVNFAEFSKKCSERWKTVSEKEKSKFDKMAKADKVRYDREMKDYGLAKGVAWKKVEEEVEEEEEEEEEKEEEE